MNHISGSFEKARTMDARDVLHIPSQDTRDYLAVTGLDLLHRMQAVTANTSNTFLIPLDGQDDADEVLNKISRWVLEQGGLDQHSIHGHDRHEYNLGFYRIPALSPSYPSLVNDFFIEEYVFPDQNPSHAHDFNALMRMLDRDRLGLAMRKTLMEDLGIPERENAPHFWRRDLRACNHPDMRPVTLIQQDTAPSYFLPAPRLAVA